MKPDLSAKFAPTLPPISRFESWGWMAGTIAQGAQKALSMPRLVAKAPRPSHVPLERVVDFDFGDFKAVNGAELPAHEAWHRLQQNNPGLFWTPRNGAHWVAIRADVIEKVAMTPDVFSSSEVAIPRAQKAMQLLPLEADPPVHQHYRNLVAPWFTPKATARMREGIRALAVELIESLRPQGHCEFINDVAKRFPIGIFLQLVDLPHDDREKLLGITNRALHAKNALQASLAFIQMASYAERWIRERRIRPGEDMLSALVNGEVMGRPLTHTEIQSFVTLILFGGLDTVAAMLSFIGKFLAENPAHRQQLIDDPSLIPNAIDEMMRRFGIVNLGRLVTQDTDLDGVCLKKGEMILMCGPLHGIDDRRIADPMTVDFSRDMRATRHAAFGMGIHRCVGASLARTEMAIFLEEWLKRIPNFSVAPGQCSRAVPGFLNSVESLPLIWTMSATASRSYS